MTADVPSTRPYLIRALHQWCTDHGFTPYLAVSVDGSVRVPSQHVVSGEIVLNVSADATGGLVFGDDFIEFKARFGGVPQQIVVPVGRVSAIYARENGQGMAFPVEPTELQVQSPGDDSPHDSISPVALVEVPASRDLSGIAAGPDEKPPSGARAVLKRIK